MENHDWSRFSTRININADIEKIFSCWTTQAGLEDWFLRLAEFKKQDGSLRSKTEPVQVGDTYLWRWYGYPDEVDEKGEVLEMNGKDFFVFRFGKAGICTVRIKEAEGEKIVELQQTEIPTDEESIQHYHVGCKAGWTFYLANLKSFLEGGIDLRNKNLKLTDMLNS